MYETNKKMYGNHCNGCNVSYSVNSRICQEPGDYTDTRKVTWYFNYVKYVSEQDIMTGLNETTFGPMENLARAQFATILYRMAGSPETVLKINSRMYRTENFFYSG